MLIVSLFAVVGKAGLCGSLKAGASGCPDCLAAALVLVVGGDVADARVQPGGVVLEANVLEFGA